MLVLFHERERSFFTFHINQKVEERCSFQPKSQRYKGVTSHFHFLLFHNIFVSTFQCSTIYLFPLFLFHNIFVSSFQCSTSEKCSLATEKLLLWKMMAMTGACIPLLFCNNIVLYKTDGDDG